MKTVYRPASWTVPSPIARVVKPPLTPRYAAQAVSNKTPSDAYVAESPLDVVRHDLDYLEKALGPPLGSVVEAHEQVVCELNPLVAKQRTKELDTKLQELHDELSHAHKAVETPQQDDSLGAPWLQIHETEEKMAESLRYVTEMEKQMSRMASSHPELKERQAAKPVTPSPQSSTWRSSKEGGGIENTLDLNQGLKEYWYPVEFSSKLSTDTLLPLELFGEKWVLFRDAEGKAVCLQDECAHRACPLSIGKLCDGHVQCPYHGWEYNSKGDCVKMPSTKFCKGVKIDTLPIAEADGFVWIWPGETVPTELPQCTLPPNDFEIHAELMMEVPVEHGLLLENLLDLAHAPFTHTSTFAKGWPIPDVVKFHTSKLLGGNWDPYPIDMSFETPCMVVSLIGLAQPGKIERGARAAACAHHLHQLHVCLPTNNRTTRLLYRMSLDFMHWTRFVPGIKKIWSNVAKQVMGEDLILVEGQQDRMLRGASVWRNPVTYDKLGVRYRRWRNATGRDEEEEAAEQLKTMSAAEIFSLDDDTPSSS